MYNPDTDLEPMLVGPGHECTYRQLQCDDCKTLMGLGDSICIRPTIVNGEVTQFVYVCAQCPGELKAV